MTNIQKELANEVILTDENDECERIFREKVKNLDYLYNEYWEGEDLSDDIEHIVTAFMEMFENDLNESGLSYKTIGKHLVNVSNYIYYCYMYEAYNPRNYSLRLLDGYLGNYFIRKCMWSNPKTIKSTSVSIKKFYLALLHNDKIDELTYDLVRNDIVKNLDEWVYKCQRYNDPDSTVDDLIDMFGF